MLWIYWWELGFYFLGLLYGFGLLVYLPIVQSRTLIRLIFSYIFLFMEIARGSILLGRSRVSYLRFGRGNRLLFAFHGFGDRAAMFLSISEALESEYVVYAIDLPFHGHTEWREKYFAGQDFVEVVEQICALEGKEQFDLMGFSFGARIVERLFFGFGRRVERLWLFAPDGLETKWMFEVSMIPRPIRYLAHWLLNRPAWLLRLLGFLHRRHLINPFIYAFTVRHLNRSLRRERLFSYWLSMDDFAISAVLFKSRLDNAGVRVDVFIGNRDEDRKSVV